LILEPDSPTLEVSQAGTTVYVDGLSFVGAPNIGVRVDQGMAWLDRSRVSLSALGEVVVENGGNLTLRNCFVGGGVGDVIRIDGSSATILYTTIVANEFGVGLACWEPDVVSMRNSIVLAGGGSADDFDCAAATVDYSVTESAVVGTNNVSLNGVTANELGTWFQAHDLGDFHLTPDGADVFAQIAEWNSGDPMTDIDGDGRPTMAGSADHPGGDVP
jgi:hypothetical protein